MVYPTTETCDAVLALSKPPSPAAMTIAMLMVSMRREKIVARRCPSATSATADMTSASGLRAPLNTSRA